jgi:Glycosyl hydrolases family 32 N-terminal domain
LSLGPDDYAAVSWSDAPNQRKVIIGWMSHWTYANQTPTREEGWRGMMTIPRVLSFKEGSLRQSPPEELLRSRGAGNSLDERGVANSSRAFEIELELDLEQIPKEISKWPRRNGLSARKRQRPMSKDLGLLPMTPQTGHCARAASQAVLKELLEKGLARRGVSGCVASAGQALQGLPCLRALPETPRRSHHFGNLFWHLL